MKLKVGDKAPDFKLVNTDKKEVSLSDYAGKTVVLHFFPAAFTGTCYKQMCTLRDDFSFYQDLNAVVLGTSSDSVFVLIKYKAEMELNFDLLADYNHELSEAYDAQYDTFSHGMKHVSRRAAFIIDGNGIIRYAEYMDTTNELPNFDAMKEVLNGMVQPA